MYMYGKAQYNFAQIMLSILITNFLQSFGHSIAFIVSVINNNPIHSYHTLNKMVFVCVLAYCSPSMWVNFAYSSWGKKSLFSKHSAQHIVI